jgi:hypothetical protein
LVKGFFSFAYRLVEFLFRFTKVAARPLDQRFAVAGNTLDAPLIYQLLKYLGPVSGICLGQSPKRGDVDALPVALAPTARLCFAQRLIYQAD